MSEILKISNKISLGAAADLDDSAKDTIIMQLRDDSDRDGDDARHSGEGTSNDVDVPPPKVDRAP